MGRPIDEEDAINAILREYNKDDSDYPTDYQQGLSAAKKIIEQLPSAQPEQSIAQERYEDLCEYFKDCSDQGRGTLNDRKEFKSWLDRMKWHVMECNKLGRELEKLKSAQLEQFTDNEKRIFLAAMTREELICLQIDEKHNDPNLINLVEICHEIIRKVKGALWT